LELVLKVGVAFHQGHAVNARSLTLGVPSWLGHREVIR
jgi:hypothetical protein